MSTPILQVEGLRVQVRQDAVAVHDASFQIHERETFCVVGESGAGKSVLCRAIAGLLAPPASIVAGRVHISGERVDDLNEAQMRRRIWGRQVSMLFQEPAGCLNPVLTVGEQIEETLRVHGVSPERSSAQTIHWLDEVGIPEPAVRARAYPHELSGGMKQRVALALALCSNPRLLLADEPTSDLDSILRLRIMRLLQSLCHMHQTALLLVTHDISAARLAQRIAVMYAGRIVELGPASDVLNRPSHPYTQALAHCRPRIDQPRLDRLPSIDGAMPRPGEITSGCAFRTRCPVAMERCAAEIPELRPLGAVQVACWLAGDGGGVG